MKRYAFLVVVLAGLFVAVPLAGGDPPPVPHITSSTPPSPSDNDRPTLNGTAPPDSTVVIYTDASCTLSDGTSAANSAGDFQVPVLVPVPHDATTTFYAAATLGTDTSQCSPGFDYTQETPPPPPPPPPSVTLTDMPPALTNRTSASFSFSAEGSVDHYECRLDTPDFTPCSSPQPYSGLTSASHSFAVRAVSAGGPGAATEYTWVVDAEPPETLIDSAPPSQGNSTSASFTFSSSEGSSTFFCSLNSSGFSPCASPQTYSGLGDGTYTFRVQAVDAAGNADPSPAGYTWQISGAGPPTHDFKPPANVTQVHRNVGYGRLQLGWRKPPDPDFDHVEIYVSTSPKTAPRSLVYTGKSRSYVDRHFKNGQYYRYLVVSYDHARNASGGTPALVPPSALMFAPRPGSAIRTAPTFRWAGVRGAAFYNIQLWKNGEKVLSTWPGKARQVLSSRWSYRGRRHSLSPGVYVWYVWPGFGRRARARYGQLLGYASFRVR